MTNNPHFPTPLPALATITQAIDELRAAQAAALSRVQGAVSLRNDKRSALIKLLQALKGYIQGVANLVPETAATVIQSAGVAVRKTPTRRPRSLTAVPGPITGTAKVTAVSVGPRASYEWQVSTDGGKTWVDGPSSIRTKTVIVGLTPGATVAFRYRTVTKAGESDWSQSVTLIVR